MLLYLLLLILIPAIWIAFEIGLVVRDRSRGMGSNTQDKGTRYFNFISIALGITIAAILNGYSKFFFPGGRTTIVFLIGLVIMLAGMALRFWAFVTLGVSFRTTIETHNDQQVVKRGPYRLVRHPSYSGLLLICCGYGIAL